MARNLPLISVDSPRGAMENIPQDVDGALVPPENVNALADGMSRDKKRTIEKAIAAKRGQRCAVFQNVKGHATMGRITREGHPILGFRSLNFDGDRQPVRPR